MKLVKPRLTYEVPVYKVWSHGKDYVDPESFRVIICPDCGSESRESTSADHTSADYICDNCGCRFDCWDGSERTRLGKVLSGVLFALQLIFFILAAGSVITGLAVAIAASNKYGKGNVPNELVGVVVGLMIAGPLIFCAMAAGMMNLREKF